MEFRSLSEDFDTATATGKLQLTVQALDHLQPVGQPPGEPVNVGDHQGVPLDHQVQQFQKAAAVFLGSNISQGAAGADQPLDLQVQILVRRLSDRDPVA